MLHGNPFARRLVPLACPDRLRGHPFDGRLRWCSAARLGGCVSNPAAAATFYPAPVLRPCVRLNTTMRPACRCVVPVKSAAAYDDRHQQIAGGRRTPSFPSTARTRMSWFSSLGPKGSSESRFMERWIRPCASWAAASPHRNLGEHSRREDATAYSVSLPVLRGRGERSPEAKIRCPDRPGACWSRRKLTAPCAAWQSPAC